MNNLWWEYIKHARTSEDNRTPDESGWHGKSSPIQLKVINRHSTASETDWPNYTSNQSMNNMQLIHLFSNFTTNEIPNSLQSPSDAISRVIWVRTPFCQLPWIAKFPLNNSNPLARSRNSQVISQDWFDSYATVQCEHTTLTGKIRYDLLIFVTMSVVRVEKSNEESFSVIALWLSHVGTSMEFSMQFIFRILVRKNVPVCCTDQTGRGLSRRRFPWYALCFWLRSLSGSCLDCSTSYSSVVWSWSPI